MHWVWAFPFSLAATKGIKYFSLFFRLLRCFTSADMLFLRFIAESHCGLHNGVSPFGNLRITGYYAPPRSVSPLRRVLRRSLMSRHPPYALIPVSTSWNEIHRPSQCWHISVRQKCVNGAGNINALFFFRLGRYSQARRKFNLSKSGDKRQTKNRLEAAA